MKDKDLADVTAELMVDSPFKKNRGGASHAAYFGVSGVFEARVPDELNNLNQNAVKLFNHPQHRAAFVRRIRKAMLANTDFAKDVLDVLRDERYVTDGRLMNGVYLKASDEADGTLAAAARASSDDGSSNTGLVILAVAGVLFVVICMCKNIFGG